MANSKHAHLRYNILDYCFRYKALSAEQLLEYVNDKIIELYPGETISIRTLREDIKLFGEDKILWIDSPYDTQGLIKHISNVINHDGLLKSYKNNMLYYNKLLSSWNERINNEILILEELFQKEKH